MSSVPFREHRLDVDGTVIACREAGAGGAVVVLHDGEACPDAFEQLLVEKFRVIALEIPDLGGRSRRDVARLLAQAARAQGLERYVLMAGAHGAAPALWQTLDDAARVEALVLISPTALSGQGRDPGLEVKLGEIAVPTLVLVGTNDTTLPPSTGQSYVERIPDCYHMLVYDCGPAVASERPEAVFEAVADFIERRGRFIVERNDSAISP
jgi:pimeloyl-ACP methyl ester carboxylesterase